MQECRQKYLLLNVSRKLHKVLHPELDKKEVVVRTAGVAIPGKVLCTEVRILWKLALSKGSPSKLPLLTLISSCNAPKKDQIIAVLGGELSLCDFFKTINVAIGWFRIAHFALAFYATCASRCGLTLTLAVEEIAGRQLSKPFL